MSSLRNAVKRITHKERGQPQSRSKLGFLEKKVDYRVRAKDYHRKQDRLNAMRAKAAMRNPDEFYFKMHNSQVKDGRHRKTEEAVRKQFESEIGHDTVRIMKDQDLGFVRMQRQRDAKKAEKLKASLHLLDPSEGNSKKRKHTVFVDSEEEARQFDVAEHFDTFPELAGRAFNRPRKGDIVEKAKAGAAGAAVATVELADEGRGEAASSVTREELEERARQEKKAARKIAKAKLAAYRELEERQERMRQMDVAESHLITEKLVAAKGRKRKIAPAENGKPAQYKWRRKRLG